MARAALLCIGILACRCPCSLQQAAPPPPQASTTSPFGDLVALSPLSSDAANAALRADNRARISPCDVLVGEDRDRECTPSSYYSQRGEAAFKRNQVEESCDAFDTVIALAPQYAASMWQRGLSLFYCERLEDGMAQFALDVTRNPNDTEESIWHYLCNARHRAATVGASRAAAAAQSEMLRVGQEGRPVMRAAMALYTGDGTVEQLLGMASADSSSCATGSNYDRATCYNYFYTHLYLGLWYEAGGDLPRARTHIVAAATSGYRGARSTAAVTDGSDYMLHVARVHARRRGWDADAKQASPEEEGMPPTTAPAGPTGCADVTLVTQSCGGETSTGHPPSDCSSVACGRAFVSWFEACPAASSSPDLTTFHARCLETHSSGH